MERVLSNEHLIRKIASYDVKICVLLNQTCKDFHTLLKSEVYNFKMQNVAENISKAFQNFEYNLSIEQIKAIEKEYRLQFILDQYETITIVLNKYKNHANHLCSIYKKMVCDKYYLLWMEIYQHF